MTALKSLQHTFIGGALILLPLAFNFANNKWGDITLGAIFLFAYHHIDGWLNSVPA